MKNPFENDILLPVLVSPELIDGRSLSLQQQKRRWLVAPATLMGLFLLMTFVLFAAVSNGGRMILRY